MPVVGVEIRRLVAVALVAVVALVLVWRHVASPRGSGATLRVAPIRSSGAVSGGSARAVLAGRLVVDVAGAVRRPGLVRLPKGARVADAVARAGGFTRRAQRSGVNLAAPVVDGEQVLVPVAAATGPVAGAAAAGVPGAGASGPVSLSAATAEQLDALPGIGPVTAAKIVAYRQQHGAFMSVDELDAIPGIGPSRIANLQGLVVP